MAMPAEGVREELSAEFVRSMLHYDPATGIFTWRKSIRNQVRAGDVAGYKSKRRHLTYIRIQLGGRAYRAHNLAWLYMTGCWPAGQVDHVDLNGCNNAWLNLRPAEPWQNMGNTGRYRSNTSGFKGVGWHKAAGKWAAQIQVRGKKHHLGLFETAEAAASEYQSAATKYFGEFARVE